MARADFYNPDPMFAIEYIKHNAEHRMPQFHYHQSYELYVLEEGSHDFLIDDAIYGIDAGDVALLKPSLFHKSRNNQFCARTCVYFTDRFLKKYYTDRSIRSLLKCFEQEIVTVSKEDLPRVKKLLLQLEKEREADEDNRIFVYLAELLTLLNRNRHTSKEAKSYTAHARIAPVLSYIHTNYNQIGTIEEIADRFYLSKYYLCRIFKESTGLTLLQYINNIKIQQACNLLVHTDMTILEVATACGFNSSMYFCKMFKAALSVTPGEFRKSVH